MPTTIGLYYPSINFQDEAWLKLAALYWDKIARIVPAGFWNENPRTASRQSETIRALQGELGFIEDLAPRGETTEVGQAFLTLLDDHRAQLGPRYLIETADSWSVPPYVTGNVLQGFSNVILGNAMPDDDLGPLDPRVTYIHVGKVWDPLVEALISSGYATRTRDDRFLGVHPTLGGVYMAALAEGMAKRLHVSPVTDNRAAHLAAAGWTIDRMAAVLLDQPSLGAPTPTNNELKSQLASIAIATVVPKDIEGIPVEKIIRLRKNHHAEFLEFHEAIRDTIESESWLEGVSDDDALRLQLETVYTNSLAPHIARLDKNLGLLGVPTAKGAIGILKRLPEHIPMIAAGLAAVGAGALSPALAPAATVMALVVVPILRDRAKAPQAPGGAPSAAAYLLEVREGLKPKSITQDIARKAERVIARAVSEAGGAADE